MTAQTKNVGILMGGGEGGGVPKSMQIVKCKGQWTWPDKRISLDCKSDEEHVWLGGSTKHQEAFHIFILQGVNPVINL